jgi:hypothetical protein
MQRIGSGRISEGDPGGVRHPGQSREGNDMGADLYGEGQENARAWIARRAEMLQEVGGEGRTARPQMDVLMHTVCYMLNRLGAREADVHAVARAFGAAEVETDSIGWRRGYEAGKETMRKIYGPMEVGA